MENICFGFKVKRPDLKFDRVESLADFIPDLIAIDYPDIAAAEDGRMEYRHRIDEIWKTCKNLAATRYACVLAPTQANKKALEKKNTKAIDVSEEGRKLGHVDMTITLSQTEEEQLWGVMRLGLGNHRWKEFSQSKQCHVLQSFKRGQVFLDSW